MTDIINTDGIVIESKREIFLPLNRTSIDSLKAGDRVLLTGYIYTARDAAHKLLFELLEQGKELPINIAGETIYYAGPCPAKPGEPIGSAGPTTSGRMDKYTPSLIRKGLLGMIGKGDRNNSTVDAIKASGAVYFGATGGAGALIAQCVKSSETVAFSHLGTESIKRLYVEKFPVIVLIDSSGANLYDLNRTKYSS